MRKVVFIVIIVFLTSCRTQVVEYFVLDDNQLSTTYCARDFSFKNDRSSEAVKAILSIADSTRSEDLAFSLIVNNDTTFIKVVSCSMPEVTKFIPQEDVGVVFYPTRDKKDVKRLFFSQKIEDNLLFVKKGKKRYCFKPVIVELPSNMWLIINDRMTSYRAYAIGDTIHVIKKVLDTDNKP